MKRVVFLSLFLMTVATYSASSQKMVPADVPSVVMNSFKRQFPKAADVEWCKSGTTYKVEFEIGIADNDNAAWYDTAGKLIKHKREIAKSNLPDSVKSALGKHYPGYKISDCKVITESNKVTYSMEVEKGNQEWKLTMDSAGNILSKEND